MSATYWCEQAWLPEGVVASVRVVPADGSGVVARVEVGSAPQREDVRLAGLVVPGLANAHSHAFHRALRGRTHDRGGDFWAWRERMYTVADRLDPDTYLRLATAVYAEMALAGITAVGEFHYLHHGPGGTRYGDPNAMGLALVEAARSAGIRITLLDACYLAGGLGPGGYLPLDPGQRRFSDGTVERWLERVLVLDRALGPIEHAMAGAAIHSVRAVPPTEYDLIGREGPGGILHVHLSEQPAENQACLQVHGVTPTRLLADAGLLGQRLTAVHAVHLTDADVGLLGRAGATVCACPTTEADLADGIAPFAALARAGAALCLGTDQHVQTDLLAEAQRLDQHERLRSGRRATFGPTGLLRDLTVSGHSSLGWPRTGAITPGHRLDLVALRLDSVRTAGAALDQVLGCASAADVHAVVVDGAQVVTDGQHRLGDVGRLLAEAIEPLWADR